MKFRGIIAHVLLPRAEALVAWPPISPFICVCPCV